MPITRIGLLIEHGYYVCRGCGTKFTEVGSIRRHQAGFCHYFNTSPRESEQPVSMQRMMGS
jgi:hypothetical protein